MRRLSGDEQSSKLGPKPIKQEHPSAAEVEFHEGRDLQGPVPLAAVVTLALPQNPEQADSSEGTADASPSPKVVSMFLAIRILPAIRIWELSGNSDCF
jgi:hypothetical protein